MAIFAGSCEQRGSRDFFLILRKTDILEGQSGSKAGPNYGNYVLKYADTTRPLYILLGTIRCIWPNRPCLHISSVFTARSHKATFLALKRSNFLHSDQKQF